MGKYKMTVNNKTIGDITVNFRAWGCGAVENGQDRVCHSETVLAGKSVDYEFNHGTNDQEFFLSAFSGTMYKRQTSGSSAYDTWNVLITTAGTETVKHVDGGNN